MVSIGYLTLATLIAFYYAVGRIFYPIERYIDIWVSVQRAKPSAERISLLLEQPEEKIEGKLSFPQEVREIVFSNVSFSYNPNREVLTNINLRVKGGEWIAIVGESGSGKTTLAKLIPRFYDPTKGSIKINGIDIREYKLDELRSKCIYLDSKAYLFNLSVRENITLGEDFSEDEIVKVCKICKIDFVKDLNTRVGEGGELLSEGQRQRIALARAIIRRSAILILDEALSGVDAKTEGQILRELRKMNMIVFIISHRLSTIRTADEIVLLHEGRIVAEGTHDELYRYSDIYRALIRRQVIKEE